MMLRRSRGVWRAGGAGLLLAVMMFAAACAASKAPVPESQQQNASTKSAGPKTGGEAVIALPNSPASLDPALQNDWTSYRAISPMFDRLIQKDEKGNLVPGLAKRWEVSPDGLAYTLYLRDDVTFHDGTKFNAQAVKFNFERHLDPKTGTKYNSWMPPKGLEVAVVDDSTVRFDLKEVYANFLNVDLAEWSSMMVSPTAVQKYGAEFAQHPVGTGPFKFKEYVNDSYLVMERNDKYWGGAPHLDSVRVRIIPETSVQVIEMEGGNVDATYGTQAKDIARLESAGVKVITAPGNSTDFISFNLSKKPSSELAVRQAIALAIDRDPIIKEFLQGRAIKARAGAAPYSPYYDEGVPMVEFNLAKAKKLLDDAGWKPGPDGIRYRDGQSLSFDLLGTDHGNWLEMNQVLQDQLNKVGIASKMTTMEWGTYLDNFVKGKYDITFHSQGSFATDTMDVGIGLDPAGYWNVHRLNMATDPEMTALADKIHGVFDELGRTIELAKRKQLVSQVQKLSQEQQLVVYLWHQQGVFPVQPRLKDYKIINQVMYLDKAWIDK